MKSILERRRKTLLLPGVTTATPILAASSAAVIVQASGTGLVLVNFAPSSDCYIRFGTSAVTAATSADFRLYADLEYLFSVNLNETPYFRVIRVSADGTLVHYVPGGTA